MQTTVLLSLVIKHDDASPLLFRDDTNDGIDKLHPLSHSQSLFFLILLSPFYVLSLGSPFLVLVLVPRLGSLPVLVPRLGSPSLFLVLVPCLQSSI